MISKIISDLKSYAFYSVLPSGCNDYKNYINHNIHIICRDEFLRVSNLSHGGYKLAQNLDLETMFADSIGIISDLQVRLNSEEA